MPEPKPAPDPQTAEPAVSFDPPTWRPTAAATAALARLLRGLVRNEGRAPRGA
jgi:hypothetical protein